MIKRLSSFTLIAFILGILGGFLIPQFFISLNFIGTIYINLLKMMIIPILFCGISSALATSPAKAASKITIRTIILFIIMFVISFLVNTALVVLVKPGANFHFQIVEWSEELTNISFADFILSIIPSNIFAAAANNSILPSIIFAFAFGIAIRKVGGEMIKGFMNSLNNVLNKILSWIINLTPIGVFFLIGNTVANYGTTILKTAIVYVGMAWLGCFIVTLLVMILPVWIYCKINPINYIKKISEIWIMTISTCSSAATLPNTIRVCNEKFNIPEYITNIVVPLGCTIHMCGGAISFSLLALFNMQMFGIPLTFGTFAIMLFTALLINMGAPGIPGGGIIIGATFLSILGIPLDFIGFYAGIYRLLDMAYTTMNVTGDITANCLIKESL